MCDISIVVGSWGSYNNFNEKALGSKWIKLSDYSDWEEIETELKSQGFELEGIDEELFIQDIDNFPSSSVNWDYLHPKQLYDLLQESGVLKDNYKYETMQAFIEVRNYDDFKSKVKSNGYHWGEDIRIYSGYSWEDYGKEMFDCCGYNIDERLLDFFNFEAYGRYIGSDCAEEFSSGIIEIL